MKVLIVGSGGREHALAWKIAQSDLINNIYCAPGNAGIAKVAECIDIGVNDFEALADFAQKKGIDLTVVGPEEPLVKGLTDVFAARGLKVFGPDKMCAQFEGSKAFTKAFLGKYEIPTAKYQEFTDVAQAERNVGIYGYPTVIKADGLAAGKGVIIAEDEQEAKKAVAEIMRDKKFGKSGEKVVIEEFLTGTEASILCFVDGGTIVPMESARDYKNIYDGNKGPNTGGMGTYSPNRLFEDKQLNERVENEILKPIIEGMKREGMHYVGVLFVGLMIEGGEPKVLEFNVRFGDPEVQSILMRLKTDLVEIMNACIEGRLEDIRLDWTPQSACCVVLASGGYPAEYEKGKAIAGLEDVEEGIVVFHAATKAAEEEGIVTSGGRVLGVTALGESIDEARAIAYRNVEKIHFEGAYYRKDIALL